MKPNTLLELAAANWSKQHEELGTDSAFIAGAKWGLERAATEVESYSHWLRQQNLSSSPTAVRQLADKIRERT